MVKNRINDNCILARPDNWPCQFSENNGCPPKCEHLQSKQQPAQAPPAGGEPDPEMMRLKRLHVSQRHVLEVLRYPTSERLTFHRICGLPDNYTITGVYYNHTTRGFDMVLHCPEWPPITIGTPLPEIPLQLEQVPAKRLEDGLIRQEFIAWVRHFIWCGYQVAAGQQLNWVPTVDQFESLMDGVAFLEANPDSTAAQNHDNWMNKKQAQGWKYGPEKDPVKKTHPDLVPYSELPEVERVKDELDMLGQAAADKLWDMLQSEAKETPFRRLEIRESTKHPDEFIITWPGGAMEETSWQGVLNWLNHYFAKSPELDGQG